MTLHRTRHPASGDAAAPYRLSTGGFPAASFVLLAAAARAGIVAFRLGVGLDGLDRRRQGFLVHARKLFPVSLLAIFPAVEALVGGIRSSAFHDLSLWIRTLSTASLLRRGGTAPQCNRRRNAPHLDRKAIRLLILPRTSNQCSALHFLSEHRRIRPVTTLPTRGNATSHSLFGIRHSSITHKRWHYGDGSVGLLS